MQQAYKNSVL